MVSEKNVCPDLSHLREQVRDIVKQTDDTGKEVALQVCEIDGDMVSGEVSQGNSRYRVRVNTDCLGGELRGVIHTHPGGVPIPSDIDIAAAARNEWDFVCVADQSGKSLGCYCLSG